MSNILVTGAYGLLGLVMAGIFLFLSSTVEVRRDESAKPERTPFLGLHQSQGIVLRLSALFALDAFGGGFVMQSLLAYWLHVRFGADPAALGGVFLAANLLGDTLRDFLDPKLIARLG